jgi:uroporphyrinogen decarboxylase
MARIPPMMEDGGYIPTIDHSVPPDISYDNFRYYLEVKMRAMEG